MAQKSTKRRTIFFLPKSATFLVKGAQFLTPRKNFMHRFCWRGEILHFFPTFYRFFTKFSFIKVLFAFSNSIKVHKIFSRSHLTLKVAPMCSKTHIIKNSASKLNLLVTNGARGRMNFQKTAGRSGRETKYLQAAALVCHCLSVPRPISPAG